MNYGQLRSVMKKLKALITAELVSVTAALIDANRFVEAAVRAAELGQTVPSVDLSYYVTRPMPFTTNLGVELLVLSQSEIDALTTLRASLSMTEASMMKEAETKQALTSVASKAIQNGIRQDMRVLAGVFDEFAPERKFAPDGGAPELASVLLRRLSKGVSARSAFPCRVTDRAS